ncbi:hypothetical protein SAMN05216464_108165 [Mucilaginibacter pineti]|uniref:Uncharacterized protein n=1 Tax=Mucilaginibacter pineti TaxID=1391627 RepID=A0A1G7EUX8_9SPHI|nr:hypothetical protein [Mucilaginibacter pineti]SDE67296.1 hypothetical protein SAMN05216464_108165 [Mucilaginibacter pineti]
MADNAGNFIAKFAPDSYFFIDSQSFTQSATQAFGPVPENENGFRITSKFTITGAAMAYAICSGVVCIQPQSGSTDKVNLVLRPFKQPIQGVNIKYFIYRGLNKSDFFNGDNVLTASGTTSDFINKVNANFAAFYNTVFPGQSVPPFLAKYVGFDPAHQTDTLMLDSLFFKLTSYTGDAGTETENTDNAFELPLMQQGASLGSFASGECGIDVVLSYGDYQLPQPNDEFVFDLAYARALEKIIDVTAETNDFKKKQIKEQIFQFLDIAAYYGFHSNDGGSVKVRTGSTAATKKGEQVYTDLLQGFYTRNNLYLYIQSDRTRSYNFYENYGMSDTDDNSLLWGYAETSLTPRTYDTAGWPLIIDNHAQAHNNTSNPVYLQFVTDNNVNTMLYGQAAVIKNAQSNNFCNADNLQLPDNPDGTPSALTKVIILANPATGPGGAKLNIATFNILLYQGVVYDYISAQVADEQGSTINVLAQPSFFDDIFDLLTATPLLKAAEDTQYSALSSQKVKLINHYYNDTQYGVSAVQTSIINDTIDTGDTTNPTISRVTYITDAVDILNNVVAIAGTVTADTKSSPSISGRVLGNKAYQLPDPFYYDLLPFTDSTQLVNGLLLKTTDNSVPGKITLGLTKAENDLLKGLISANSLTNPRPLFINLFTDKLISTENVAYEKYQVVLIGETVSGELKLMSTSEAIIVYTIDKKCFFSKGYAAYVKDEPITSVFLDLEISL